MKTPDAFPFKGRYSAAVIANSKISKKHRKRLCTVVRLSKKGDKYLICWDGTKTMHYITKRFIRKVKSSITYKADV